MNELPLILGYQRTIDANHLKLLYIFHFIGAGLGFIGVLLFLFHYMMFSTFLSNTEMWANQQQHLPLAEFFEMFKWFYLVFAIWFISSGVLHLVSDLYIRAKRNRTFSIIVSGFNYLDIPIGTLLGVFTIVVLIRKSVQELYDLRSTNV